MSANAFLEAGARRSAAQHPDGPCASMSAPMLLHRGPLRRLKEQCSQPKLTQRAGCAFLGSSTRQNMEICCYARADQLDGLRPSGSPSLAERIFDESYKIGELLGIGSFGKVYRATHRSGAGLDYAVKIVSKHREGFLDERVARRIHEEVWQLPCPRVASRFGQDCLALLAESLKYFPDHDRVLYRSIPLDSCRTGQR